MLQPIVTEEFQLGFCPHLKTICNSLCNIIQIPLSLIHASLDQFASLTIFSSPL